jgi:membrane-bound lytic murein transglycosylase D
MLASGTPSAVRSLALGSVLLLLGCASAKEPAVRPESGGSGPAGDTEVAESQAEVPAPREIERVTWVDPAPVGIEPATEIEPEETEPEAEPEETEPIDVEGRLQESLEAYETANELWQQGNLEQAYGALDIAYELMASVPLNGDPLLAQQKEDLRQLIAERVLEIHASQHTVATDLNAEIPLDINQYVQREIESFQGPERELFLAAYARSGMYRPMIEETFREAGMPDQLGWLPVVESWFKVRAYSRARALGMWQFIASTGYRYGLERNWWIDERMDPEKSTRAAAAYLTSLHRLFGDWLTALAAYNCGESAVIRAINRQSEDYLDQFWDIYTRLPRETRRFVPRFLATLTILNDPEAYGFDLPEPMPPLVYDTIDLDRSTELASVDSLLGLASGTTERLNPELRRKATPDEPYTLKVPVGKAPVLTARLDELPQWVAPASITTTYRVRRGDTLSGIAARHGTSVSTLMDLNNLRSAHRISQGQRLYVPDRRPGGAPAVAAGTELTYNVRPGDSLWSLARRYGTTVDRIKRDNQLGSSTLQPGQSLAIRTGTVGGETYVVRSGDTLGKIADRAGVSLRQLMAVNGLSSRSVIYPGQRLAIPR